MFRVAFTTMWDMFSFYGMKALLIAYIVTQLRLGQPMGYAILGTYAALVFGFNFFGGMVADKFLGTRKAIIWGGYLQITGHLILAIPSDLPPGDYQIIVGLYDPDDPNQRLPVAGKTYVTLGYIAVISSTN